jgi:hypothetical protein
MRRLLPCAPALALLPALAGAETLVFFQKITLTDKFYSEGAACADFNQDGKMDVIAGPYIYLGPDYKKTVEIYPAKAFEKKDYSKNFLCFADDLNGDKYPDVLVYGFPGEPAAWYENPKGKEGPWVKRDALPGLDNESPMYGDVSGDGKPDIVCMNGGALGYATADADPNKPWTFHAVTPKDKKRQRFSHGIGYGDLNGDGKIDLLEQDGWWEQPATPAADGLWKPHPFKFAPAAAQMLVYDVDGDKDNDVITAIHCHNYGITWYENVKEGGEIAFKPHVVIGEKPEDSPYGLRFSQAHAFDLADFDGDGVLDFVTGKRHWAHGEKGDKEPGAPAVVYWFRIARSPQGVDMVPFLVDDNSGVGTQVMAADMNGDKVPDIVVANKTGAYVFLASRKTVSKAEWEKAQPKKAAQQ